MRIERITVFHVRLPLLHPWTTAYGKEDAVETIFVRMETDGLEGWGESSPLASPFYSSEYAGGCFAVLRDQLARQLVGRDIALGEDLEKWLAPFKGNYFAKAALDAAWWDLRARASGMPLYRLLGGQKNTVMAGDDFGIQDSIGELLDLVGAAVATGAPRIKLKYGPGWDTPVLERVRAQYPDVPLHIDCNSAYSLDDMSMFRRLEKFRLTMIEQPLRFDDLNDHARLQREISVPLCLDESITSIERMRQAIELGSCQWVNIKPGRVGGLTNALKIHDLCRSAGIPCWVGGMLESSLGAMLCAALATLENFKYPADLFPFSKFYKEDITTSPLLFSSPWHFTLPEVPGVGTQPDKERMKRATLQEAAVTARS